MDRGRLGIVDPRRAPRRQESLLGGLQRPDVSYFYYLARGSREELEAQVEEGLDAGFEVFYLKVGLDDVEDL